MRKINLPRPVVQLPYFSCKPDEIRLLRKVLGWTQPELAAFLGVYYNPRTQVANTVSRWERGVSEPLMPYKEKLCWLAKQFSTLYLREVDGR